MTSASVPLPRATPLTFIRRHWRLVAVVALGLGPFLPSILAMREFLLADNALGFTPFALPAAAYLFWARSRSDQKPTDRDILVDLFVMSPLVVSAFFILFITPSSLSWYFWLNRVDLAALTPWATAVALTFLGYQRILQTWPAWVMLIFTWPYPAVWVQRVLTPLFVDVTAAVARYSVGFFRLPYDVDASEPQVFVSTHLPEADNFVLVVGQLCSGTSATIGFLIVGATLAFLSRGSAGSRVRWLAAGLVLAFVSNLIRVIVLLTVAGQVSRDVAVEQVHPVLGMVLFCVVIVVMLLLLKPFGLRFDPVPHGRRLAWEPVAGGGKALRLLWVLMVAAGLGIGGGVAQAQQFDFIGVGDGAPAVSVEDERGIIPELPGWKIIHETEISWTDLFGGTSRGDVFTYYSTDWQQLGDPQIGVQTVVTEDRATLERYSLEQCIDFHQRDLEARRAVDIGYGITAYILHDTYEDIPSSVLYWVMPVNVDGEVRHARIALFGDAEALTALPGSEAASPQGTSATSRFGQALENAMDGLPDPADDLRADVDRGLVGHAIAIVDVMVQTGGPGVLEEAEATAAP